jgi:hypothetical protein
MQRRKFIFLKKLRTQEQRLEMLHQGVRIHEKSQLESVMSISGNVVPLWAKQSSEFFIIKNPHFNVWSLLN